MYQPDENDKRYANAEPISSYDYEAYWNEQYGKKNAPAQVVVGDLEQKEKVTVKKVDWRKSLIDTPLFQQLKNPLPAPLDIGVVGNPKPFVE